jgi:putative heme iron utilization protein
MSWITQDDWQAAEADPLAPYAAGAIAHMNVDHADTMVLYCRAFSKATDIASATLTGVDRYGFDMSARTPEGPRPIRVAFPRPVTTPDELRAALVAMAKDARSRLG